MIEYLRKLLSKDSCNFTNFDLVIELLTKNKYISRLIRNFYYILDIEIPEDFLTYIKDKSKLNKLITDIKSIGNKTYFKENALIINIDDLYDEYHYLNHTKTSKNLYYINIINYSVFCAKYKNDIKSDILLDLLNCIINALDTYAYNDILILYKKYLSIHFIFYRDVTTYPIITGGNPYGRYQRINPNKKHDIDFIKQRINNEKVFFYFSFNTFNEKQFSLFEFTNILLIPVDETKSVHGHNDIVWNLYHDADVHWSLSRKSQITLLESYRLYKLLKLLIDEDLKDFPWAYCNESTFGNPFNLFELHKLILIDYDDSSNLRGTTHNSYIYNNKLLTFLEKNNIIEINPKYKELLNENYMIRIKNRKDLPENIFIIIDKLWKFRYNDRKNNNNLTDEELFIENLSKHSDIISLLEKYKLESIDRVKCKNGDLPYVDNEETKYLKNLLNIPLKNKYLKYKQKYIKLKKIVYMF